MRSLLASAVLGAAITAALGACSTTTSPTGRTQYVGAVSQQQLVELGERAFAETKAKLPMSNDARQQNYVRCVVDAVVRELPPQWQQARWESAVFVNRTPNAFALPGGKVGVYTGIFEVARNQDELAGVIAHEVGHVVANHHDERITRQYGAQSLLTVGQILAGARYGEGAANALGQVGGMTAQGVFLLPGSRAQETEADVVGQELMAKAGFDPRGAIALWENMIRASDGARAPQWMSTHPDPAGRLQELRGRADQLAPVYQQARAAGRKPNCG